MENTPEQTAEGTAVVRVLATVLERLVNSNANVDHGQGQVTKFHALKAPGISILQYLERIHKYSSCSTECFILALIYIDRLIQRANFILTELNVHRVVITSVLLAAKFFDDAYYNNAYYAKVGGVLVSEMNGLEVEFLFRINFSLHVTPEMFAKYQAELVSHATSPPDNDGNECSIINNNNGTILQSQAQPLLEHQPQRNVCAPLDTMIANTTKQDSSILIKGTTVQQQEQPVALDTMVNEFKEQDASIPMDCMTQESVHEQQSQEVNNQHKYNQNPAITPNEMEVYQQQQQQPTVTMYVPQRHITPSPPQVQNRRAQIGAEEQLQEFASKLNQTQTTSYPNYQNTAKNRDILIRHHSYPTVNNINNQHSTTVGFEVRPYSDFEQTEDIHTATKASLHHHPISEPPLFTSCSSSNNHFSQYPEINTFGHSSISPNTSSPHYVKQNW